MTEMTREQKYATTRDEELVLLAQSGDEEAQEFLLDKYKFLVRAKSRAYFLIGADNEDIIQEGMIGLYKAACAPILPSRPNGFCKISAVNIRSSSLGMPKWTPMS